VILRAHINISKVQEGRPFLALRQLGLDLMRFRSAFYELISEANFREGFLATRLFSLRPRAITTRECLAIEVDTSLGGLRVVAPAGRTEAETRTGVADPQRQRT
jgi:hypothetical protein